MNEWWIPLACMAWVLLLWISIAGLDRSSISPAALFLGYWFFGGLCPMIAWQLSVLRLEKMEGYYFLALAATFVAIGAVLFRPRGAAILRRMECQRSLNNIQGWRLVSIYRVVLLFALSYPILLLCEARRSLAAASLLQMPTVIAEARYTIDWNPGFLVNGLNSAVFVAAALSGVLCADRRLYRSHRWLALAAIVPGLATYYLTAARTGILFPAVFWLGSFLAVSTYFGRCRRYSFSRFFRGGVFFVVLVLPIVHIGYMVRTATYDWGGSMHFLEKSMSTAFGHMSVLGHWFGSDEYRDLPAFELKTFAGVAEKVGMASREQGLYQTSYPVGSDDSLSNIYTVFRPLIEDGRGVAGGVLLLLSMAGIANFGWHRLRCGNIVWYPVVMSFYVYVLWGLITSIYIYMSTIVGAAAASLIVWYVIGGKRRTAGGGARIAGAQESSTTPNSARFIL